VEPGFFLVAALGLGVLVWRRLRGAPPPGRPAMDDALDVAVHVAFHEANVRCHSIEPLHLFYGLLQDDDVRAHASRLGADLDAIERAIFADLDGTLRSAASLRDYSIKGARVLNRALGNALRGDRPAGLADLLGSLLPIDPCAARACAAGGLAALDLLVALVHGPAAQSALDADGAELAVVLMNDDISTMELVVEVLEEDFGLEHETAIALMLQVHEKGRGRVGTFSAAEARAKAHAATARARAHGAPLLVRLEPV
jgi:ATP-dependent Clp protease adaptor protein ClpS